MKYLSYKTMDKNHHHKMLDETNNVMDKGYNKMGKDQNRWPRTTT
jgi:hypothetical protein